MKLKFTLLFLALILLGLASSELMLRQKNKAGLSIVGQKAPTTNDPRAKMNGGGGYAGGGDGPRGPAPGPTPEKPDGGTGEVGHGCYCIQRNDGNGAVGPRGTCAADAMCMFLERDVADKFDVVKKNGKCKPLNYHSPKWVGC